MIGFPAASNAADWNATVLSSDAETGEAFSLSGYLVEIELRASSGAQALYLSTANGLISITSDGFRISVPAALMKALPAATYSLKGRVVAPTGEAVQIFNEPFGVYDGGFN